MSTPPSTSLFDVLEPEVARRLLAACVRRRFGAGEVVFHEGDPAGGLHVLDRGRLAVRVSTPLGDVATVDVLGPGEVVGEQALLRPGAPRSATVVALERSETLLVPVDAFELVRSEHPGVDRLLVRVLDERLRATTRLLLDTLYQPADVRVLRRLAWLTELEHGEGGVVEITLTQDDLASLAGVTRPTANRALRAAQAAGLVQLTRGRLAVTDLPGLRRAAGLGSAAGR